MKFFHYSQNNSGGSFTYDEESGITHHVVIEAPSAHVADARAEEIGLYWDGCDNGQDCSCCGDRWGRAYGDGSEVPSVYGEPVETYKCYGQWLPKEICVHYLDGRMEWHLCREDEK